MTNTSCPTSKKSGAERLRFQFGGVDILLANAGVSQLTPIASADEDEEVIDEIADINFKGVFFTIQKALPGFRVYAASKAALQSLTKTFSVELAGRGIRANVLSPGFFDTPAFDRAGLPRKQVPAITKRILLERFGSPEEMGKAVVFLASSDSSAYVTGAEFVLDGDLSTIRPA